MPHTHLFQNIELETLSYCNLRCPTCPVAQRPRERQVLSEATFRRVIDELAGVEYAGTFSPHFYNEPFADGRLPEFMHYAARMLPKATLLVFTNTTLLNRALFQKMPSSIHEYVVTVDNEEIRRSCDRLLQELEPEQRRKIRRRSIAKDGLFSRGGAVSLPGLNRVQACSIPTHYCAVNAAGEVLLCYNDYFGESVFGNVNTTPLLEIWNSPGYAGRRAEVASGAFQGNPCRQCETNVPEDVLK